MRQGGVALRYPAVLIYTTVSSHASLSACVDGTDPKKRRYGVVQLAL